MLILVIHIYTALAISMATKRGRPNGSSHIDLTAEQVADFLSSYFVSSLGPTGVFPYSKGKASNTKKSLVWGDLKRTHLKGSVLPADSKTCKYDNLVKGIET